MHVLAFRHSLSEDIGSLSDVLVRHGIECQRVDLYAQPAAEVSIHGASGIILMGGPMSVNDDLPWIPREIAAIREAVTRGLPVLGICLGSQLIAKALGVPVYPNVVKEIGWHTIRWKQAAQDDALFSGFRGAETVFQWHGDTYDLPPGAEWLAESDACRHQAYRVGSNVYGIQFHPEVTPEIISLWLQQDAACGDAREARSPIDPYAHAGRVKEVAARVFTRWFELLR